MGKSYLLSNYCHFGYLWVDLVKVQWVCLVHGTFLSNNFKVHWIPSVRIKQITCEHLKQKHLGFCLKRFTTSQISHLGNSNMKHTVTWVHPLHDAIVTIRMTDTCSLEKNILGEISLFATGPHDGWGKTPKKQNLEAPIFCSKSYRIICFEEWSFLAGFYHLEDHPRTDGYVVNNHGDRKSPKDRVVGPLPNRLLCGL